MVETPHICPGSKCSKCELDQKLKLKTKKKAKKKRGKPKHLRLFLDRNGFYF